MTDALTGDDVAQDDHAAGHADCDGGHHHHGSHHHHHHAPDRFGAAFATGIVLNASYVVAEAVWGVFGHSVSLLADAGHNLGDVLGLAAAWLAGSLSQRAPSGRFTYGLRRSSILSALGNAVVLLVTTGAIAAEAVRRLIHPEQVASRDIVVVASLGILVNGLTALLFAAGRKGDLNLRGAFLHMAADALVSAGVVLAGLLIWATGWQRLDPLASLAVAAVIVTGTWSLLRDSVGLAMDAVPPGIDRAGVEIFLRALPGVTDLHDLHIWGMSTTETALTAHLIRPGLPTDDALLREAAADLQRRFGIGHATFQVEHGEDGPCVLAPSHVV